MNLFEKKIIKQLNKLSLSVEEYLCLLSIGNTEEDNFLEDLLIENSEQKQKAFIQKLIRKDLIITIGNLNITNSRNYILTEKSLNIIEIINNFRNNNQSEFNTDNKEITDKKEEKSIKQNQSSPIDLKKLDMKKQYNNQERLINLVKNYMEIFPKGAKNKNGDYIKSTYTSVKNKMNDFLIESGEKYTDDDILKATERYIKKQKHQNFAYCQMAHYFINKDGGSRLEIELENYDENEINNQNNIDNVLNDLF